MGTWGTGPFDNDTAADWGDGLDDTPAEHRHALVRGTLIRAADAPGGLDTCIADEAVAAAALVAGQCGGHALEEPHDGPEAPLPDLTDLRTLALEALDRVMTDPSELLEAWVSSADAHAWRASIDRMRAVLTPASPGEQLALDRSPALSSASAEETS
ncbi:DUF4259 domain-containing protein [Streptomyces sp. NPDC048717]|uniref:DUF4259 domain-containing protein n=1 Tax=Streptomyces sp. NPDC048717 TaxID=3154928 RepID=UPI003448E898